MPTGADSGRAAHPCPGADSAPDAGSAPTSDSAPTSGSGPSADPGTPDVDACGGAGPSGRVLDARESQDGVVSLEFVLLLPLLALLLGVVLQVVGVVRDVLVVQDLARQAVRVAAVSADDGRAHAVVTDRLVEATVDVTPVRRRTGSTVHVVVRYVTDVAGQPVPIVGRATAMVEPGVP